MIPHNPEAEHDVIGYVLLTGRPEHLHRALRAADFFVPANRAIWSAVETLQAHGHRPDMATVCAELGARLTQEIPGGADYLVASTNRAPGATSARYAAGKVAEAAANRRVAEAATRAVKAALEPGADPTEVAQALRVDLVEAEASGGIAVAEEVGEELGAFLADYDRADAAWRIPSGVEPLDRVIDGARPGQLITIAGRPGHGKSSLAQGWAAHAASRGVPALFFSLEMSRAEQMARLVTASAQVPTQAWWTRSLSPAQIARCQAQAKQISSWPLRFDDTTTGLAAIVGACRSWRARFTERGRPALVVVDYLQLVRTETRGRNREQEVAGMTRDLKLLAKELELPVLMLAQLNRSNEREARPPELRDLRESGAIEQDSNVVLFPYRETMSAREACIIVGKNRDGDVGDCLVNFEAQWMRYGARADAWTYRDGATG